jgi:glycosyltransferase involved in cell wall biosynthesis
MTGRRYHVGVLATHPIQYYAPWYRALESWCDLEVFFSHRQTPQEQAEAGFAVAFDWDVPLLEGIHGTFLRNVARTPNVNRFWGCVTPEIASLIRERHFDAFIVHGWSTASYWQAIRACWRSGTPVLVRGDSLLSTPRSWARRLVKRPFYRWFIPRFDGYLVVGAGARQYLLQYGADPARCFRSPHCVDNNRFAGQAGAARQRRDALRSAWSLPADAVVFLFAGRFVDRKQPLLFVEAIAAAARRNPRVAGLMVGDGPLGPACRALVSRLQAPVQFAGFLNQSRIAEGYAASDALVVPSVWETWGLVVNEAMACGLPAIVTAGVGCAEDLVRTGDTGFTVPTNDLAALANAIGQLAADDSLLRQLGRHATRRIAAFSPDAAAAGALEAVREVTLRRQATPAPARPFEEMSGR